MYDMSYKYFSGLRPEDDVIDSSSLTKFRKLRLTDENILDILIGKSVEVAIEKGNIKSKTIIVDATHTKSRYNQKSAYECPLLGTLQIQGFSGPTTPKQIKYDLSLYAKRRRGRLRAAFLRG